MSGVTPSPRPSRRAWWWLLVGVGAIALVTLLVAEPWTPVETEPTPSVTAPTASVPPEPSATPSVSVPPPGADAVFDATTAPGLFVTAADVVADIPAAGSGVDPGILAGQLTWGLPEGSTIDPPSCTIASTVVATPPLWFDARSWGNETMDFEQEIVLLADPAAAREAFRELVTTVDACPEYTQVNAGIDGSTVKAQPAIEGQGVYPSIVVEQVHSGEGQANPGYVGHMLVGNTIVSWTAEAFGSDDPDAELASLGDPESLSTMVQDRAQLAVRALSRPA